MRYMKRYFYKLSKTDEMHESTDKVQSILGQTPSPPPTHKVRYFSKTPEYRDKEEIFQATRQNIKIKKIVLMQFSYQQL